MPAEVLSQRRLTLVIHSLHGGGAERVLVDMANHWSRSGNQVTLITLATADTDVYDPDAKVARVCLDLMRESRGPLEAIWNNLQRARALRRALRRSRPDFVISFTDQINVLTLVATIGTGMRVIISDRCDPRHHPLGRAWTWLRQRIYRRSFAAVVQTESIRQVVQPMVGRQPIYVIPNAVRPTANHPVIEPLETVDSDSGEDQPERPRRLIAMGRLVDSKGFDMLIDAFARLADRHPNWTLDIFGTGASRETLEVQIARHNLSSRIKLPGWIDEPQADFARADLFVLSSRFEGFPNVLLDAMACGLAAVSFDCPSGPGEIIRHQVDGLLVEPENVAALSEALNQLMSDTPLRRAYGERAVEVADRFSAALYFARWEAVFAAARTDDPRFEPAGVESEIN